MKLEEIRNKLKEAEQKRWDTVIKLKAIGAPESEVIEALGGDSDEMVNIACELSQCVIKDVINVVGLTSYNAPFLAGALMAAADSIVDGVAQDDEEGRRRLIVAAECVALGINHRRELITIKQPMNMGCEEE